VDEDRFIEAVAQRAEVSRAEATDVARATMVTLSERISGGEARDLADQLPDRLRSWLLPTEENAERLGLAEFLRRVSVRAQVDTERAQQGARAVLATLREGVAGKEFADTLSQLPKEFWAVVEPTT
jgi:uncharacterized protein (DUF2267 family)